MIRGSASRLSPNSRISPNSRFAKSEEVSDKVYCPVCLTDYPSDQREAHIIKHTLISSKVSKQAINPGLNQITPQAVIYPMIEPLQFSTFDLGQVIKKDSYRLNHQQINRKKPKLVIMVDCQTQTLDRPLLQEMGQQTDICNCFDNLFTGGKLSEDIVQRNVGLASKRKLTQWQSARVSK